MTTFHFIAGLPRSGSTLLAAILRQNPAIHASMSSPVGGIFLAMQKAISGGNEAALFLSEEQRIEMLRAPFESYYREILTASAINRSTDGAPVDDCARLRYSTIFDTNRMWPSKLPVLTRLFPECKIVCCVRQTAWIMDSIERLIRRNPFELSGIFGFEPGGTVYSRCQALAASNGLVGFALDALREGFHGEHWNRLLLVEYQALAQHPKDTVGAIYEWLNLPGYQHDFDNIEPIPGAAEFDCRLGTPGLHDVARKVEWRPRETILPPEVFNSFGAPFWRSNNPRVPVIHVDNGT